MTSITSLTARRRLATGTLAAGLLVAAVTLWQAPPGPAADRVSEKPAPLGLIGMTEEQTLRVSVANVVGFDPQPDPPTCLLEVGFVDRDAIAIGDPHILELRPGVARSLDLPAPRGDGRRYVRPLVVDKRPSDGCPAVVTAELLDPGSTNGIIIIGGIPVLQPQPDTK